MRMDLETGLLITFSVAVVVAIATAVLLRAGIENAPAYVAGSAVAALGALVVLRRPK